MLSIVVQSGSPGIWIKHDLTNAAMLYGIVTPRYECDGHAYFQLYKLLTNSVAWSSLKWTVGTWRNGSRVTRTALRNKVCSSLRTFSFHLGTASCKQTPEKKKTLPAQTPLDPSRSCSQFYTSNPSKQYSRLSCVCTTSPDPEGASRPVVPGGQTRRVYYNCGVIRHVVEKVKFLDQLSRDSPSLGPKSIASSAGTASRT